jgi:hypothetical protein
MDLSALINANGNLNGSQKGRLIDLLSKYRRCFTGTPSKCNVFEYQFRVNEDRPIVEYSRPIPFAVRPAVRNQIRQMLQDDILEYSDSPFLNPLTVIHKEGQKIRICVDARKINQHTVPDRERTPPLQELLQRFEGAKFMTTFDFRSAYLQIPLHKDSRKYTAFLFDATVCQYKRTPYGFRNSLSAFVRALKLTLGSDTESFVVFYVDDVLLCMRSLINKVN